MAESKKRRFESLDALRGVALMVALYHMDNYSFITDNFVVNHAPVFVDYFFVLSGFVITHSYINRLSTGKELRSYIKKRTKRIYPLHIYTLLVFFLFELVKFPLYNMGYLNHPPFVLNRLDNFASAVFMLNSTGIGIGEGGIGWNFPSWSISAEFISYLIFGLFITYFFRKGTSKLVLMPLVWLLFIYLSSGGVDILAVGNYSFLRGGYGFFIGVSVYLLLTMFPVKNANAIVFSILEILSILILLLFLYYWDVIKPISAVVSLLFGLSIIVYSVEKGIVSYILKKGIFQKVGAWSYSIYLNHVIVVYLVEFFLLRILKIENTMMLAVLPIVILGLIILYSSITYRYVEMKFFKSNKVAIIKRD